MSMTPHIARSSSLALHARGRVAFGLALGLAVALGSSTARADGKDLAQLRQIFADGRTLEDDGKWSEALAKFKDVAAEKITPQVRFHIAFCEEKLGKLVSAKRGFELAGAEAVAAGSAAVEVPPAAKQHADALALRIAKLTVDVKGKPGTSKIVVDDAPLAAKDFGVEIEVDPGAHTVEVRDADGKQTFLKELSLQEKGSEHVEVALADEPVATADTSPAPSRKLAYIVGGAGLGALALSGVFFGLRAANVSSITSTCANQQALTGCSPADASLASTGKAYTGVADTLAILGGAALGTGVVLYFVLGSKKTPAPDASSAQSHVWIKPYTSGFGASGSSGLRAGGSF